MVERFLANARDVLWSSRDDRIFIICMAMLVFVMRGGTAQRAGAESSVDILKERCARGEINATEYEERRRVLEG